ncbi:MAG: hypothetical protein HPY53_08010 [Brevinematales bacterium]|nr:hypothetical protein [Brevinematales bacterium]
MKHLFAGIIFLFSLSPVFCKDKNYPYAATAGKVTVYSDISPDFSKIHAEHGNLCFQYFNKLFNYSPGNEIVIFYTTKENVFQEALKKYPAILIKGGRQVTSYWDKDHRVWYIMPYQTPDFGTQLHELSHDFLYFTFLKSEEYPWFKEGSGMYFESGSFDKDGELAVDSPLDSYKDLFIQHKNKNDLLSLKTLLFLKRAEFYQADFTKTYSQSMMFFYYLAKKHPETLSEVFTLLNERKITDNNALVKYILDNTGMTLDELEKAYIGTD